MELTQILSIVNVIILIGIPVLMWYLNKKTTKEIEKLKIREDFKVQTYKRLFDAPDDIIKVYLKFWEEAKKGDMSKIDLTPLYKELLLLVRQDLGYANTRIKSDDVVRMLLSD